MYDSVRACVCNFCFFFCMVRALTVPTRCKGYDRQIIIIIINVPTLA